MGGLCSSPVEEMLRDLQQHCDEQTEIIETMIEVEAEDKSHVRALKKDVEVLDILMDQYESALKSLGDLLPEETVALLEKLSSKRARASDNRRKRAAAAGMEMEAHIALVRPSDAKIQKAQSTATAKKVASKHAETSDALKGQVEARRERARERVQKRLTVRSKNREGSQRLLSLSPLPDSVRRHPSLTGINGINGVTGTTKILPGGGVI